MQQTFCLNRTFSLFMSPRSFPIMNNSLEWLNLLSMSQSNCNTFHLIIIFIHQVHGVLSLTYFSDRIRIAVTPHQSKPVICEHALKLNCLRFPLIFPAYWTLRVHPVQSFTKLNGVLYATPTDVCGSRSRRFISECFSACALSFADQWARAACMVAAYLSSLAIMLPFDSTFFI